MTAVATSSGTPIAARTTNTPRHEVTSSTWPPMSGAATGTTPVMPISTPNRRAATAPPLRSRTIARAMTMPTLPAIPWMSRITTSTPTVGETAHATDEAM